ncbi:MAG: SNF2-related protein, partial [Epsilonproteobacteria bacterium]|nr:SNF2-related protein [Campylobacterota bacterium]
MIIDNKQHGRVGDVLKQSLTSNTDISIMTNRFSIFAFQELRKELSLLNSLRLLLSNPLDHTALLGNESERTYRNRLIQSSIAKELTTFISKKAQCKQTIIPQLGTNLTYSENANNTFALQGSSEFSAEGLGYAPSGAFAMNTLIEDAATVAQMGEWFESIWSSDASSIDAKSQLLEMLEQLSADNAPDSIYFTTLYRLFSDITTELNEDSIIKPRTGFKETIVWSKLYNFQRDGVLGAIDKLERYNGCIIADSVGLGKTFEALAVIKYYELRNDRVLVLCPKKLRDNWAVYTINDKRNVLAHDRFNYDVLNHTDLTREGGKSGEIDLRTVNWGNYDLIVIDESHNFRNNNPRKDGVTRYSKLMNDIIKSGVKTKVLMLSATPVNNRLSDLKNQIYFITEGENDAFADEGIAHIENSLNRAQKQFNQWQNLPEERRTVARLLDMINFEYFKLLDLITIARSRKHIDKYYDTTAIGTFPERLLPLNIKSDIDLKNEFPPLLSINRTIRRLSLAAYSPFKYILPGRLEEYSAKYDTTLKSGSVLRQSDREQSLIHLLRVNMLKRMESSINSFALTIGKFIALIDDLLRKIDKHEDLQFEDISILDIDTESDTFSDNL